MNEPFTNGRSHSVKYLLYAKDSVVLSSSVASCWEVVCGSGRFCRCCAVVEPVTVLKVEAGSGVPVARSLSVNVGGWFTHRNITLESGFRFQRRISFKPVQL